ncbi:MAG: hypothetical protein V2A71_02485 [Candidatus Eisenbacteria bacterium]
MRDGHFLGACMRATRKRSTSIRTSSRRKGHGYLLVLSLLAVLLAASTVLGIGCSESTKPKPEPDNVDYLGIPLRTSPENVLAALRVIYSQKDNVVTSEEDAHFWAERYRDLFSPDTFKFWFLPGDVPDPFPLGWWGTNDEIASFDSMLTAKARGTVTDIQLTWTVPAAVPDDRAGDGGGLLHPNWMHIEARSILLDVVFENYTLRLPYGLADFYFSRDPRNLNLWVITEWIDREPPGWSHSAVLAAPDATSWGKTKGLFYLGS